jgi:hypothetical protein
MEKFDLFMIFVIIVAGVLVGMETYPYINENPVTELVDNIVLGAFTLDVILKIFVLFN